MSCGTSLGLELFVADAAGGEGLLGMQQRFTADLDFGGGEGGLCVGGWE